MKKITVFFLAIAIFFAIGQQKEVAAAEIVKIYANTAGSYVTAAYNDRGQVRMNLKPTVKGIRYARYVNDKFSTMTENQAHNAGSKGRLTGFAVSCPGYYIVRIYSDTGAKNSLGYIKYYASKAAFGSGDIKDCKPVDPPTPTGGNANQKIDPSYPDPGGKKPDDRPITVPPKPPATKPPEGGGGNPSTSCTNQDPVHANGPKYKGLAPCGAENVKGQLIYYYEDGKGSTYFTKHKDLRCEELPYESIYGQPPYDTGDGYCMYKDPVDSTNPPSDKPTCPAGYNYNAGTKQCVREEIPPLNEDYISGCPNNPDYCLSELPYGANKDFGYIDGEGEGELPPDPENPDGETCKGICEIFECPGWEDYMSGLGDIADNAANKIVNAISNATNIILKDGIGSVTAPPIPDLPRPPMPNIFDVLNKVDSKIPEAPKGQEDPGLGDSTFNAKDLYDKAPEIEEREDPTGGFDILNPIDQLPEDGSSAPKPNEEDLSFPRPGEKPPDDSEEIAPPKPGGGEVNYPGGSGDIAEYPKP